MLNTVENYLTENGITMCDVSMEIDAKLTQEAQYYMGSYKDILKNVSHKGNEIMNKLT